MFPLLKSEMCLIQDTVKRSDRNLAFVRHDSSVRDVSLLANEFNVTAALARFRGTSRSSRCLISRTGSGLSQPNLDRSYRRRPRGPRGLEIQFKSLF